jgi:membrane-anchored protein YejM (alkaline phosphatase superfamily)
MKPNRAAVFLAAALAGVLLCGGCRRDARPRNFILVTLDTMRADHLGVSGKGRAATPNLDALAARGTLFRNATSLTPVTLTSHAVMFFSEPPSELKLYNNGQTFKNGRSLPSLAALFKKAGFATAAFISLGVLQPAFGLSPGFDTYAADFPADRWYLRAGEVNARVLPWLEANRDKPFFLWVHYSDPHEPYTPPGAPDDLTIYVNDKRLGSYCLSNYTLNAADVALAPGVNEIRFEVKNDSDAFPFHARFDVFKLESGDESGLRIRRYRDWIFNKDDGTYFFKRTSSVLVENTGRLRTARMTFRGKLILPIDTTVRADYRREVEYMDGEFGRLAAKLGELGLAGNTAILAAGDHGEGLGEYNDEAGIRYVGHIHFLQDVFMRVPLIFADPARSGPPEVRGDFVSLLDVAPTAAGLMGLGRPSHFRGRDLRRASGTTAPEIFQETYKPEALRDRFGILSFPWHLIFTPELRKFEAYDLGTDPDEMRDLAAPGPLPDNVEALRRKLEARAREILAGKETVKVDKSAEDMLRALGYIK